MTISVALLPQKTVRGGHGQCKKAIHYLSSDGRIAVYHLRKERARCSFLAIPFLHTFLHHQEIVTASNFRLWPAAQGQKMAGHCLCPAESNESLLDTQTKNFIFQPTDEDEFVSQHLPRKLLVWSANFNFPFLQYVNTFLSCQNGRRVCWAGP